MTRHPRERMPKEKAAPKSGFKFRRGCLKGMVFVHRTKRFRKCEKLIADCENCNPLIATRLPCFTDADCVIPAPFSRESPWFDHGRSRLARQQEVEHAIIYISRSDGGDRGARRCLRRFAIAGRAAERTDGSPTGGAPRERKSGGGGK